MATVPQICGLLLLPERKDALNAVTRTIGKIRQRHGLTVKDIARSLKQDDGEAPHSSTLERAERQESMLSFDLICQLATIYHDCAEPLRNIMQPIGVEPTTLEERLERAEREIMAVRRELCSDGGAK